MMKHSRFSLLGLLGSLCACSGNVELERPVADVGGASANVDGAAVGGAAAGAGNVGDAGEASNGDPGAGAVSIATPELTLAKEHVEELLSDGTRLYWIDDKPQLRGCIALSCAQSVMTYGAVGGAVSESNTNRIRNFDFTEQRVVWRATAGISSCPKSGCGDQQILLASDSVLTWWGLSASGSDVYWSSDLDIYRCADTGCNSVPSALASSETTATKLVFHGHSAYWIGTDGIRRAPRDGSEAPTTIISGGTATANGRGVGEIDELGIDAEVLYWLGDSGHILSCPIAGCAPKEAKLLVPTASGKQTFQVDASGLYWLDDDAEGAVVHCPLAGCTEPTPLTPGRVHDFALDQASLYWSDDGFYIPSDGVSASWGGGLNIHHITKLDL